MADITTTAANVKIKGSTAKIQMVQYGETIAQSQPVYSKAADSNKYWRADADTLIEAAAVGCALTPGVAGDYGIICTEGPFCPGGTVAVGTVYVVSTNPGGIAPNADLGSGDFVTQLGVGIATDTIQININRSGIAKA